MFILIAAMLVTVWVPQPTGSTAELRGISVYAAKRAWASGSGGTVLRTRDGGPWEKLPAPAGGEALDFRDIEALDGDTVVLMSAGPGAASRIFRSTDGGKTWADITENLPRAGAEPIFVHPLTGDVMIGSAFGTWLYPPPYGSPGAIWRRLKPHFE